MYRHLVSLTLVGFVLSIPSNAEQPAAQPDPKPDKLVIPLDPLAHAKAVSEDYGEVVTEHALSSRDSADLIPVLQAIYVRDSINARPLADSQAVLTEVVRDEKDLERLFALADKVENYRPLLGEEIKLVQSLAKAAGGFAGLVPDPALNSRATGLIGSLDKAVSGTAEAINLVDKWAYSEDARARAIQFRAHARLRVQTAGPAAVADLHARRLQNDAAGKTAHAYVDGHLVYRTGFSPDAKTLSEMVETNPRYRHNVVVLELARGVTAIREKRGKNQDVTNDLEKFKAQARRAVQSELDALQKRPLGVAPATQTGGTPKLAPKSADDLKAELRRERDALAGLTAVGVIVGLVDRDAGRAIGATVTFAGSALAAQAALAAGTMGPWGVAAVLVVAAIQMISSILSGPDLDEILLNEFRAFVKEYRADMTDVKNKLDQIDRALGKGFAEMLRRFDRLEEVNGRSKEEIKAAVEAARLETVKLSGVLGLMRVEMLQRFDLLGTMTARAAESDFRSQRSAGKPLEADPARHRAKLADYSERFRFAAIDMTKIDLAGQQQWPGSPDAGLLTAAALQPREARPWHESKFIDGALGHYGRKTSAVYNLPNWVRFADAYADLAMTYPEAFAAANIEHKTAELIRTGQGLRRALARPVEQTDDPVLTNLLTEYFARREQLRAALDKSHADFRGAADRAPCYGLDPLGPPDQPVAGALGVKNIRKADRHAWHDGDQQTVPKELLEIPLTDKDALRLEAALPPEVRAAIRLRLGALKCQWYEASWGGADVFKGVSWNDGGVSANKVEDKQAHYSLPGAGGNGLPPKVGVKIRKWDYFGSPTMKFRLSLDVPNERGAVDTLALADRLVIDAGKPVHFSRVMDSVQAEVRGYKDLKEADGKHHRQTDTTILAGELTKRHPAIVEQFIASPLADKLPEHAAKIRATYPNNSRDVPVQLEQTYWRVRAEDELKDRELTVKAARELVRQKLAEAKETLSKQQIEALAGIATPAGEACARLNGVRRLLEAHLLMTYPKSATMDPTLRGALRDLPDGDELRAAATADVFALYRGPELVKKAEAARKSILNFAKGHREPERHDELEAVIDKLLQVQVVEKFYHDRPKK